MTLSVDSTADVVIGADGQCEGGWVCEHRWTAIAGMAGFSKATNGMSFDNWVNSVRYDAVFLRSILMQ